MSSILSHLDSPASIIPYLGKPPLYGCSEVTQGLTSPPAKKVQLNMPCLGNGREGDIL